jgi:hypothetical protein
MDYPNLLSNGLVLKVKIFYWGKLFLNLRNFSSGDVFEGEILYLPKLNSKSNSVDKYECVVDNGMGDTLRKTIVIHLRGKSFI